MSNKLLLAVSDTHCGSEVGLAPPESKLSKGNIVSFGENHHQRWLWDNWLNSINCVKKVCGRDKPALLLNGDAIEGRHHGNEDVIAQTNQNHAEIAKDAFKPLLAIVGKIYVVAGTYAHTKRKEDYVAREIKAEGHCAKNKWLLDINGTLVDCAHHMGTTSRVYLEASLMSIHMGNARLNYLRSRQRVPDVFIRSHRHCGGWFCDGQGLFCVTGGWQFLTRHGYKVVTDSIPHPTMILLDWRDVSPKELPRVHEFRSIPPQLEIAKV